MLAHVNHKKDETIIVFNRLLRYVTLNMIYMLAGGLDHSMKNDTLKRFQGIVLH